MSHEIMKSDKVVLSRVPAWHGLGTVIDRDVSVKEALARALNWEPVEVGLVRADGGPITTKAICRSDDPTAEPLGVVSDGWKPILNSTIADVAAEVFGDKVSSAGSVRNGRLCFISVDLGRGDVAGDETRFYGTVTWGHDGVHGVLGGASCVRVVCANTWFAFDGENSNKRFRQQHRGFSSQEEVKSRLVAAGKAMMEAKDTAIAQAEFMAGKSMTDQGWSEFRLAIAESILAKKQKAWNDADKARAVAIGVGLTEAFDDDVNYVGGNWASAFNAATSYLSHDRAYRGVSRGEAVALGAGSTLLKKAAGLALEFANA